MNLLHFFQWLNTQVFGIPATILFFGVGIILTLKTRFVQIRSFPYFISLITQGVKQRKKTGKKGEAKTISSFHALFAAMATTIGTGSIVGPSIAIITGGPGALFWLLVYIFFGAVTKFTEVTFALFTREKTKDGNIIGGPMQYLKSVSPILAAWYSFIMIFLFAGWSAVQSNTLASIFSQVGIPKWTVGLGLALFVLLALSGGAKRVGDFASKMVPLMFGLYVTFGFYILCKDFTALQNAISLVIQSIFSPRAAIGGFAGATMLQAIRAGIYKGIYITEAGVGTSSIPHAVADTKRPIDQGILAMGSIVAEMTLSILSGLIILVTGVWMQGSFRSTLIYEAFKLHTPVFAQIILLASITLFILTTVMGNSFNGVQSFGSITRYRWTNIYIACTVGVIFLGALISVPLIWEMMDTVFALVAIPNLIGILILAFRNPQVIKY